MKVTRIVLAVAALAVGLFASAAMSHNNKYCFYNISCGDRLAPCRCLDSANTCTVCTGSLVSNWCFRCAGQKCNVFGLVECGRLYRGVCTQLCHTCPRFCAAVTLIDECKAERCL
jgi:hypothetical protein